MKLTTRHLIHPFPIPYLISLSYPPFQHTLISSLFHTYPIPNPISYIPYILYTLHPTYFLIHIPFIPSSPFSLPCTLPTLIFSPIPISSYPLFLLYTYPISCRSPYWMYTQFPTNLYAPFPHSLYTNHSNSLPNTLSLSLSPFSPSFRWIC